MRELPLVKWIKWLIYVSALVPLVILAQYLSPFHFGKVVVLRSLVEVMVALYLILIWRDRSYLPKSNPITWAFLAFTSAFTITSFFSVAWLQSLWGTLERMGGLFTFWHYFLFYVVAVSVLRSKDDWRRLLDIMVAAGIVSAVYGLLQRFDISFILGSDGRQRIFGTIGNPALFAGYQLLIGFLSATLFLSKCQDGNAISTRDKSLGWKLAGIGIGISILSALISKSQLWLDGFWIAPLGLALYGVYLAMWQNKARMFYGLGFVLTLIAVAMTAVRGSLVATVAAIFIYTLLYSSFYKSRFTKRVLLTVISLIISFIFLSFLLRDTSFIQNSSYLRRVTDFSPNSFTIQTRLWAWSAGFQGWSETPQTVLVGWGPENFNVPFSKHFNPKFFTGPGSETFFDRAHNMFVEVLVTMGLVGELAYLSLFAMIFYVLIKLMKQDGRLRVMGVGFTALIVAYMIHNFFIFDTSTNFLTFFMLLGYITHLHIRGIDAAIEKTAPSRNYVPMSGLQTVVAVILGIVTALSVYGFNFESAKANFTTTRAIVAGWQGDFAKAVAKYRQALEYDTPGRYEYRTKFAQYILDTSSYAEAKKSPEFREIAMETIELEKLNIKENPRDYLPYLYIARLYLMLGQDDPKSPHNHMALEYTDQALEISPTFVRTYYEIGQAYLNMRDFDNAIATFTKAIELNPNVGTTYWYLGMIKYQQGVQTKSIAYYRQAISYTDSAIEKGYSPTPNDMIKLISMYTDLGDRNKVVALHEQLISRDPTNSSYWASLSVAYYEVNRITEAINAMRKAIEYNPNDAEFVQNAQAFIRDLGGR